MIHLTNDQSKVSDEVFKFLCSEDRFMCISGAGGTGKSTLIKHLVEELLPAFIASRNILNIPCPYDELRTSITATTNKACVALSTNINHHVSTIFAELGIVVTYSPKTGKQFLKILNNKNGIYPARMPYQIIFIDECSMIDKELWTKLEALIHPTSKVIFVGDALQLPPVNEKISLVFDKGFPFYSLNQTVRTDKSELKELWADLRKSVTDNNSVEIKLSKGNIEHISFKELQPILDSEFVVSRCDHVVLSYTNKACDDFNEYILKDVRKQKSLLEEGTYVVNINYVSKALSKESELSADTLIKLCAPTGYKYSLLPNLENTPGGVTFTNVRGYEGDRFVSFLVPLDLVEYQKALDGLKKHKKWHDYYTLKEGCASLRLVECSTIHKSQGSTFDTVYINCEDLNKCRDLELARRLLYVAASRARTKVVFFGDLNPNLGRFV